MKRLLTVATAMGLAVTIASSNASMGDDQIAGKTGPIKKGNVTPELLKKYDTNGDGKLDAAERATAKADLQKKAVKPGKKAEASKAETLLKRFDANGDGKLDEAELQALMKSLPARKDNGKKSD